MSAAHGMVVVLDLEAGSASQKNSIPYQLDESKKLAKIQGLKIADITIEGIVEGGFFAEKHTAYKTADLELTADGLVKYQIERPKFQMMVQMLLKEQIDGVICLCWDRISRNEQDGMLIKKLMDSGVDFKFVQAAYEKTSSGALHRDIDGMFAQHYSRVISEKVKNTFVKFRAEGRCLGPAAIGYLDRGSDDKPIDPERGPIVRRIFEQCSTGEWSMSQLAKWANKEGLTTKPARARRTKAEVMAGDNGDRPQVSNPITPKTIENMLKNPMYIGKHRGKDGRIWDCKHPVLIDATTFFKVQSALKSRNVSIHYMDKNFYTYRGLIRCECSRSYSPYEQKGVLYYRCRCKAECANDDVNLNETEVHEQVATFLERLAFTQQEKAQLESGAHSGLDRIAAQREKALADLERKRKRIYSDLDYLMKNKITLLRNDVATPETFAADVARLEQELADVATKMDIYQEVAHEMLKYVLTFSELINLASACYKHALDTEKREMVTNAFSELVFYRGEWKFIPKDGFLALFARFDKTKATQVALSGVSGSPGGYRT
jgi:DNA invertase Pin-like site-specific DNA recombinase